MSDVDVIIPLYNNEKTIKACLMSILKQKNVCKKIYVIDNNSDDNSCQELQDIGSKEIHLLHEDKPGAAAARNKGLENTNANYVCFIDADVILPDDNWLKRGIDLLKAESESDVVGVGGLGISDQKNGISAALDVLLFGATHKDTYVSNLATMDLIMRREDIGKRRFNEDLLRAQDPEFCFNFTDEGKKFLLSQEMWVKHVHPVSLNGVMLRWYRYGLYYRLPYKLHPKQKSAGYKGRVALALGTPAITSAGLIYRPILFAPFVMFGVLYASYIRILYGRVILKRLPFYAFIHCVKQIAQLWGILMSYFGIKVKRK